MWTKCVCVHMCILKLLYYPFLCCSYEMDWYFKGHKESPIAGLFADSKKKNTKINNSVVTEDIYFIDYALKG